MTEKRKADERASQDSGWRRRVSGSPNQVGQAFQLEPHGDKSSLPKGVQQVSWREIPDYIEKRRNKHKTPEELEEDEIIQEAIEEAIQEEEDEKKAKRILNKLDARIEHFEDVEEKKAMLKSATESVRDEMDSGKDDGYEEFPERFEKIKKRNDANEVFGQGVFG